MSNNITFLTLKLISDDLAKCEIDLAGQSHVIRLFPIAPLGTSDMNKETDVSIYPNLTYSDLNIKSKSSCDYVIFDLLGSKLAQGSINTNTTSIFTSALPQGMYLILFTSSKGDVSSQKFGKL